MKKGTIMLAVLVVAAMALAVLPVTGVASTEETAKSWSTACNYDHYSLTIERPAGLKEGDVMLAQVTYEKGTDAWPITPPVDWTLITATNSFSGGGYKDIGQALYWKVAGSSEPPSYTWRFAQEVEALGGVIRYDDVDSEDPIVAFSGRGGYGETTGKNNMDAPSVDALAGSRLVGFYGIKEQANLDTPSGMGRLYQERDDENDYTILAAEQAVQADGKTGERTSYSWEYDSPRDSVEAEWVAQLVVLRLADTHPTEPGREISVYIDEEPLVLVDQPFIREGRTLVPMRAFFEALGAEVSWDAANRTAIGTRGGITVSIPIGSTTPVVNGEPYTIEVPAEIVNSRTYIPLRFVGEALGDEVVWEESTRSIYITRK